MPTKDSIDQKTRIRIAAWLRVKMKEREFPTQAALARHLDVDPGVVSRILRGVGSIGLDVFISIHRRLHMDANQLLDQDPPPMKNGQLSGHGGPGSKPLPRT